MILNALPVDQDDLVTNLKASTLGGPIVNKCTDNRRKAVNYRSKL